MQLQRIRRTALAVAVVCAVGAIAASAGASPKPAPATPANSIASIDDNGVNSTGASGATGVSGSGGSTGQVGATGATGATGVSGPTGPSGATGASGPTGPSSTSGSSGTSGSAGTTTSTTTATTTTSTATGSSGAAGGTPAAPATGASSAGGSAATSTTGAAPVVTASLPQPQSGGSAAAPAAADHSSPGGSSASGGPTAPSPALFDGSNPLAGVLPGSWDDPFIVNGAADVPEFYVDSFHIPPFLLSIYEAAGAAYAIPWQTLAAINEVETDYGTDLDVSSAGAIGWMQFLPSTWRRYGVDASASDARDPYNAADAIFATARFLQAAGGTHNLPRAIFDYNHSRAYVRSVLLRAELLSGEPSALINSVSELSEGDFPIQLRYHASYRPATPSRAASASLGATAASSGASAPSPTAVGAAAAGASQEAPAEDIFAAPDAAVVAAQDGTIVAIGHSRRLGRFVVLRNAFGDRFTYGHLGSVSAWYPKPKSPRRSAALLSTRAPAALAPGPRPTAPASAGAQPSGSRNSRALFRQPRGSSSSASAPSPQTVATLDLRSRPSAKTLFTPLSTIERAARLQPRRTAVVLMARYFTGAFGLRPSQLELARLRVGSHVLAGTILGRLASAAGSREPHLIFELRPAGSHEPLIDPRPFLDAWSQLETLELHRDSFNSPFYGPNLHPATVGTLLLTSQVDLERIVLEDTHVRLPACERTAIAAGSVDRRVLATLEVLVIHGIDPTVSGAWCAGGAAAEHSPAILKTPNAVALRALGGVPVADVAGAAVKALAGLHGSARPALRLRALAGEFVISFAPAHQPAVLAAAASFTEGFALSATRWSQLDSRLEQIHEPRVPTAISAAALRIPKRAATARTASRH